MKRRDFLQAASVGALGAVSWAGRATGAEEADSTGKRPHVLLIVADDHGWDGIGAYGNPVVRSPNLDRLAHEGVRFNRAYCTAPLCSPGRSGIMTGQYPSRNGVTHLVQGEDAKEKSLSEDHWTLARTLQSAGYDTVAVKKWHLSIAGPTAHGFNRYFPNDYMQPTLEAIDAVSNQPLFLYFCPTHTHRKFEMHDAFPYSADDIAKGGVPPVLRDTPEVRNDVAKYCSEVSAMDNEIGQLLGALERKGILDETLIVYATDHGPSMHRAKFSLYDWGIRSPLLVRHPAAARAGSVCQRLVSTMDIAPTILDLLGLPVPDDLDGRSFRSLLADPAGAPKRTYVHAEHNQDNRLRAVQNERFKLILNIDREEALVSPRVIGNWQNIAEATLKTPYPLPRPPEELYDLKLDPYETTNRIDDPSLAAVLAQLRDEMKRWLVGLGQSEFV